MSFLLVIADDFTGALDTGVQFAVCGQKTRVVVDRNIDLVNTDADVIVVDTETRHLSAKEAYRIVYELAKRAVDAGISYIYKKTDSALRGNTGAELSALLEASEQDVLPFLPAFPQMNRLTVKGIHYIDGVPVNESAFGRDPFEPVEIASVTEMIQSQSETEAVSLAAVKDQLPKLPQKGIAVFDSESVEDLEKTGQALLEEGKLHICAGCAGFGAILPKLFGWNDQAREKNLKLDERFLVVCGSVHPVTVAQMDHAEENGFLRRRLTPEQKLTPGYWNTPEGTETLGEIKEMLKESPYCIIETNDKGGNDPTALYSDELGIDLETLRQRIVDCLGNMFDRIFDDPNIGTMLLTGGDTLLQCMNYLGITELEPLCEVEKGAVLVSITRGSQTRYIITKSGGFGQRTLFTDIADRLKTETF